MILPDKTYKLLKWIALIVLPALGTLYAVLGVAWELPYVEPIKTTCLALGTFIGAVIGVSNANYYKDETHNE